MNDKEEVVNRLLGKSIKIHQEKIGENITDSFFYDGVIAEARSRNGTQLQLITTGEIKICNKNGVVFQNGKEYNDGFGFDVNNDDDLKKVDEENGFEWVNNNWFEVLFKYPNDDCWDGDIGEVVYNYDSAIQLLKDYMEDKRFQ